MLIMFIAVRSLCLEICSHQRKFKAEKKCKILLAFVLVPCFMNISIIIQFLTLAAGFHGSMLVEVFF
jgi:hypothetical protein